MSKTCYDQDVYDQYESNDVAISLFIYQGCALTQWSKPS